MVERPREPICVAQMSGESPETGRMTARFGVRTARSWLDQAMVAAGFEPATSRV
jgi:hypothetical protein